MLTQNSNTDGHNNAQNTSGVVSHYVLGAGKNVARDGLSGCPKERINRFCFRERLVRLGLSADRAGGIGLWQENPLVAS